MNTIIRSATAEDLPAILDIMNYEILHTTVMYLYDPWNLKDITSWYAQKMDSGMPLIVAEQENITLGYGTYGQFRPRPGYKNTVEHSIYIHRSARGKGLGGLLIKELIDLARQAGMHSMIAGIDAENKGSSDFHQKFGFQDVGIIKEAGFKFDRWLDLRFMQLML